MDRVDTHLLSLIQQQAGLTVAEIAEEVGISSTPVWKRIKRLEKAGIIRKKVTLLDASKIGLGLTGFVLIRTTDHSEAWIENFARVVEQIPEIVEVHRMAGDIDYLLKVVAPDMEGYDNIYKRLINGVDIADVSASFSMEVVKETTALPLTYAAD
ncbi:Lrp/AsnC family transcriptional regulator [Erythrobacter sp. F6033]|uniref:Lrp/AsnC family transcriptional regulator n=1 Tax=Erythrobacter sp. F6033 TaxID=2926401 RepID=UPI001FF2C5D1|nr:Lrp/AsnC family transcriptional regulator [Erythrobacter sp. F6033]MCK0127605.1 Lrp/AsnC family transcriptional regulator [Erythrobacter sp. F6033]